jgi:hypothetical protein
MSALEHLAPECAALAPLIETVAEEIATDSEVALERNFVPNQLDRFVGQGRRRHGRTPGAKRAALGARGGP